MRRASASISANLAEGCGRSTGKQLAHFSEIAMGSARELDYHLLLAYDLGFLTAPHYIELKDDLAEVKRMLNSFIQKLTANH